jgi:peptidyl-prolyl cis-trans isomerase C
MALHHLRAAIMGIAFGAALSGAAFASGDTNVVARVDGIEITEADLAIAAEDIGSQMGTIPEAQRRDYLIGYLVDLKIGARAAEAANISDDSEFKRRLAYYREKVLLDDYLMRETKKAVTEEAARKFYDETVKGLKPEDEVRARHILVEKEDEAKEVHRRVTAGGEDFAKVAGEISKDPGSGREGGDLGFFTQERMVKPFADAAFAMKVGEISQPVQSQFGWHIIKVEERRQRPVPSFDDVKSDVTSFLVRKTQQELILKLRQAAKIERLDKPADANAAKPGDAKPAEPKKN